MKSIVPIVLAVAIATMLSCSSTVKTASKTLLPPDSLWITVISDNLSENLRGNDEILVICYMNKDSGALDEPLFRQRLRIDKKNLSRQFQCKLNRNIIDQSLLLFLLEQDSETPVPQIDSILRLRHWEVTAAFKRIDYTGIEKYLGDEDVLGYELIARMDYTVPNIFYFNGVYKLDKYEYRIKIEAVRPPPISASK